MLSFLPAIVLFPIHLTLQLLNLAWWGGLVILLGLVKLLLPLPPLVRLLNRVMNRFMQWFGKVSLFMIKCTNEVELDYQIDGELHQQYWYLMVANHLSYLDIVLLIEFSHGRIPAPKFFLKKELIWMPFVGLGAWALDMPFMQRYSQQFLAKHPHLRGKDIETTRKSCEKFKAMPTTVINYVEGTRFTDKKSAAKGRPFQRLLPPKAGGIAFTLAAMGELFNNILDVTLQYPLTQGHPMMDMLCGRMKKIVVHVKVLPVDEHVIGDYFNDAEFKTRFQQWLNALWSRKDRYLEQLMGEQ